MYVLTIAAQLPRSQIDSPHYKWYYAGTIPRSKKKPLTRWSLGQKQAIRFPSKSQAEFMAKTLPEGGVAVRLVKVATTGRC